MRPMRTVFLGGLVLVAVLAGPQPAAYGVMMGNRVFTLDFTKPEEVKNKATWNRADNVFLSKEGLGFNGPDKSSLDFRIESTEPVAVGWSWRPVIAVSITATLEPPGQFKIEGTGTTYPSGQLYARYSPDGKHWSSWHNLPVQGPEPGKKPQQRYAGTLRVPYKEQDAYRRLVEEYSRMDVPWASDEEAAVRWILQKDPKFFEKSLPLVGYVQFLYETSLRGGQRIERIRFELSYGAGGKHSPPKDQGVYKTRDGPWRFKVD